MTVNFTEHNNTYSFTVHDNVVGSGEYTTSGFYLIHEHDSNITEHQFANAMQAFCYLRKQYEKPLPISKQTYKILNEPAPAVHNMRRYSRHVSLEGVESVCF